MYKLKKINKLQLGLAGGVFIVPIFTIIFNYDIKLALSSNSLILVIC